MKRKKILYLDQFAVSKMYNAAPTSLWGQLRSVIMEKVNNGILSCPMPLEHLHETLGRSNIDENGNESVEYSNKIAQQHRFFCEIANSTAFYGYEEIAATEIMMLLRHTMLTLKYLTFIQVVILLTKKTVSTTKNCSKM